MISKTMAFEKIIIFSLRYVCILTIRPNINFTIEFEENHEIPFLDVRIKRNLNTFTTTVHRKTTFTGLYTKWDSFTPRKYKGRYTRRSLLPQHAPATRSRSKGLPRLHQRFLAKKYVAQQNFCSRVLLSHIKLV